MLAQIISHYRVLKLISKGVREVYLAEDTLSGEEVAIKVFFDHYSDRTLILESFQPEAYIPSHIAHPSICAVLEADEYQGRPLIVMEYMDGITLRSRLTEGEMRIGEIIEVGAQIAAALGVIHSNGVIHRNIRPSNIFLTIEGRAKLFNFFWAQADEIEDDDEVEIVADSTSEGQCARDLAYMPPELLRGETLDTRADVYAFGVVLWEMLTGVSPFLEKTWADTVHSILREHPAPVPSHVPEPLQKTILKVLAKKSSKRLSSASEVGSVLDKIRA